MTKALKSTVVAISVKGGVEDAIDDRTADDPLDILHKHTFTDGTGANQAKNVFHDIRALAGSTSEELDLAGGLTDAFGNTITMTAVKGLIIKAASTNGDNIEVGGSAANGFINWVGDATDKILIPPGGTFALIAPDAGGFAVTAGTGDLLKINNADASGASYTITILFEE
jgi:hypothetical protein|tara:strand:- start:926 stop:1435 length:510 start_codon:yes stop_codon:yes gene_type:complete